MLNIIVELEPVEDKISYVTDYFDAVYESSWLNTPIAKELIKGIDLSDHIQDEFIMSPVLGAIPPQSLSSGCKGCLLLLNMPDIIVSGERFGDNCFPWLSRLGETMDITITMHHYIMSDCFPMTARVVNSDKIIKTSKELNYEILRLGREYANTHSDIEETEL